DAGTQTWTFTDGDTQATERYDAASGGRITPAAGPGGNGLTFTYNPAGPIPPVHHAGRGKTELHYSRGHLTPLTHPIASGQTLVRTHYVYDASNRLTQVVMDESPEDASVADGNAYTVSYAYDGTSRRVASMTQTDGASVSFTYALVGSDYRVASVTDALGQVT